MAYTLEVLTEKIQLIEELLVKMQVAFRNVASTEAVRQIILIKEQELENIQTDLTALTSEVELIKNEVFK